MRARDAHDGSSSGGVQTFWSDDTQQAALIG
jgi:hypothetical protein